MQFVFTTTENLLQPRQKSHIEASFTFTFQFKGTMCKISPVDVSVLQTLVSWVLFCSLAVFSLAVKMLGVCVYLLNKSL